MGLFTRDIETLDDLFVHTLQDVYYAEQKIIKAQPGMIEKATSSELKSDIEMHLRENERQIERLEQVFRMHGHEPKAVNCPAIDGLIKEANEVAGDIADKQVLDAALIGAAQAIAHYEIARYGTLVAWARELGREDCASLLRESLEEEKAADARLSALAENRINRAAELQPA